MILCPQWLQYGYHQNRKIRIVFYMNLTFKKYILTKNYCLMYSLYSIFPSVPKLAFISLLFFHNAIENSAFYFLNLFSSRKMSPGNFVYLAVFLSGWSQQCPRESSSTECPSVWSPLVISSYLDSGFPVWCGHYLGATYMPHRATQNFRLLYH